MFVNSSIQYLNLKEDLWDECLESSYGFLRTSWPDNWIGMPVVLLECLRFLNLQENNLSDAGRSMLVAAKCVAFEIEIAFDVAAPLFVTNCNVSMLAILTVPVLAGASASDFALLGRDFSVVSALGLSVFTSLSVLIWV